MTERKKKDPEYEVGYRKPPRDKQFKPGRSGNPKGRPKDIPNNDTVFAEIARGRVSVTIDGKTQTLSRREAVAIKLWMVAMSGNVAALQAFLVHLERVDAKTARLASERALDAVDLETLAEYIKTLPEADGSDDAAPEEDDQCSPD